VSDGPIHGFHVNELTDVESQVADELADTFTELVQAACDAHSSNAFTEAVINLILSMVINARRSQEWDKAEFLAYAEALWDVIAGHRGQA
jgi:hypothetical protein